MFAEKLEAEDICQCNTKSLQRPELEENWALYQEMDDIGWKGC